MKHIFKKIYTWIPGKKYIFGMWKALFGFPQQSILRHLNFEGPFDVVLPNGKSIVFYNWNSSMENQLFWYGITGWHEKTSLDLWMRLAAQSKTILDIGAYRGIYALTAYGVNPDAHIVAFEPVPILYERLRKNVELNGATILCENAGASRENGTLPFYKINEAGSLTGSFDPAEYRRASPKEKQRFIIENVRTLALDAYLPLHAITEVDLIKIDVEGHEPEVIEGMRETIRTSRPSLLIEILSDENGEKIEKLLAGLGYVFFDVNDKTGEVRRVAHLGRASYMNYLIVSQLTNGASHFVSP